MRPNLKIMAGVTLLGAVVTTPCFAAEVNLHGFVRSAFDITNSTSKYLDSDDNRGDFGSTQAGFNWSAVIDPKWTIAGQLHFAAAGNELRLDWAIASYQMNDNARAILGRQKYPLGLVTQNVDIGVTYPWTRPPQEFYNLEIGADSPNLAAEIFDGVSVEYVTGDDWEIVVHPFTGSVGYNTGSSVNGNYQRQMMGLKLGASNDMVSLQAGFSTSNLTIGTAVTEQSKTSVNIGAKVEMDNILVYAEYGDTQVKDSDLYDSKGGYLSFAYTMDKYQPVITIATLEGQKAANASKGALDQDSIALGLAYHYNPSVILKMQWKNIKPGDPTTAGMVAALPAGKTTVDIVSVSMDAIF